MNIYIIGLPRSGRTTVAKSVANELGFVYISATDWVRNTFRDQGPTEHEQSFKEAYQRYYFDRLRNNPNMCIQNVLDTMSCYPNNNFVIDGISSPKDFVSLFDYNNDLVVILNRIDNEQYHEDHDSIFLSTIKDYCFWMAAAELLDRPRWIEYNFKVNGNNDDSVKIMGKKNSVFLVKNLTRVISHLVSVAKDLIL
jgi:adenylate kinase family enzyme